MSETVVVEKMVSGGDCLAKLNGKNVFIPYAIPGEKLEIEITKSFRDYDFARIIRIIEKSPHRVEPFCKLYGKCGGCNMQHIEPSYQIELRKNILRDSFLREGIECPEISVISDSDKNYRARIQLTDGGFNEKESNKIVPIDFCPVATDEINEYLKNTPLSSRPKGRIHIFGDRRVLNDCKCIVAQESGKASQEQRIQGGASKNRKSKLRLQKNTYFSGTNPNQNNACSVSLLGKKIDFDVQGFFQSNLSVLEKTIQKVTENISGENVLDMYAGCGTFSVFLSDFFKNTVLIEHNRDALVFAESNLLGKKHESYGQSGEKWVKESVNSVLKNNGPFNFCVIDPPRSGMEKAVSQWLSSSKIPFIRSVSCNATTHARDASLLLKNGYYLKKLYLLDFYPQTSHIESLAEFELR